MVYAIEINERTFPAARFGDIGSLLNVVVPLLIYGGGIIFLFVMFWGAFNYMTAGGDKDKVAQARKIIIYSLIGIGIIVLSYLAVLTIQYMFKITLPNNQYLL